MATGAITSRADGNVVVDAVGPQDRGRTLQLALATVWLLDGALQLQPFMFTSGPKGFSGMLAGTAGGNPRWVSSSIIWNSSVVGHHVVAADTLFALMQLAIGFGIAWRATVRPALAASMVWCALVWWFGEGLGGVLRGTGIPLGGGPGAVLFYGLLAVLLWPADRPGPGCAFVAGRAVGATVAMAMWSVLWVGMAVLGLLGTGRSPQGVHDLITALDQGQPGWLQFIDRHAAALVDGRGLAVAVVFATLGVAVGAGIWLPRRGAQVAVVTAVVIAVVIWIVGEDFGMILAGGATDPNSGPVLLLIALAYWPLADVRRDRTADRSPVGAAAPSSV